MKRKGVFNNQKYGGNNLSKEIVSCITKYFFLSSEKKYEKEL